MRMKPLVLLKSAVLLSAVACLAGAAGKQPVHIYVYERVTDHINIELSENRLRRALPMIEKLRRQHPEAQITATILLSGAMSEALESRNSETKIKDLVLDYVHRGVIELGYDGTDEPTYQRRVPDFAGVKTAEDRWVRRGEAAEHILTEAREPLTGIPIPGKSGGLKRMQEIFGPAACITGVTDDLGGDSESIQRIARYNSTAILFGTPDPDSSRNIHGFRGSAQELGRILSPAPDTSSELFWQDNFLRSSETSDAAIRRVSGYEGQKTLETLLSALDRTKIRIVHLEIGDQRMYLKPDYSKGLMYPPLKLAYAHPDQAKLPPDALRDDVEVEAAFAKEEAALRWLVEDYLVANPSSRFVSSTHLRQMTPPSLGFDVPVPKLREAITEMFKIWDANTLYPPSYLLADGHYLSLADMFQVMTDALTELHSTGKLPVSVRVSQVYGPLPVPNDHGRTGAVVTVASVAKVCAGLVGSLHDISWSPIPKNRVPSRVMIDGNDLNAAQFLRLMSEAMVAGRPDAKLTVKMTNMLSLPGEVAPKTRQQTDQGATWTYKPAPLEAAGAATRPVASSAAGKEN